MTKPDPVPAQIVEPPRASRPESRVIRAVARVPASVRVKLLVPVIGTVVLLIVVGILGLRVLGDTNDRVVTLGQLRQRATAYRELERDAAQLQQLLDERVTIYASRGTIHANPGYGSGGTSGITDTGVIPIEQLRQVDSTITSTMAASKLSQLGTSIEAANLGFQPPEDEATSLLQVGSYATQFSDFMAKIVDFDKTLFTAGGPTAGMALQHASGEPLANNLEGLTAQLASATQNETDNLIAQNASAFSVSQAIFVGVALVGIVLALLLGYVLALSLTGPIRRMQTRLAAIAAGDFSSHVEVVNRDELGELAVNLNLMNDELGRLYRELEAASRHKSEFLATMSHELRTPLNAIIGFSQVLKQQMYGPLNERQGEYIEDVLTSGQHLLNLINDILDLAKVEAGRMELQPSFFLLPGLLESAVSMIRERAGRHGLTVSTQIDPAVGTIEGDERKVKQIVFNLLSNAVKFTPEGGTVTLAAATAGDAVRISVSDTGVGIQPEEQAKIFEEFYQVGSAMSQEGTGLGLALTKRLVELHHGRIDLESQPGKGSTFTVTLPLRQPVAEPEPAAEPVAPAGTAVATAEAVTDAEPASAANGPAIVSGGS